MNYRTGLSDAPWKFIGPWGPVCWNPPTNNAWRMNCLKRGFHFRLKGRCQFNFNVELLKQGIKRFVL